MGSFAIVDDNILPFTLRQLNAADDEPFLPGSNVQNGRKESRRATQTTQKRGERNVNYI